MQATIRFLPAQVCHTYRNAAQTMLTDVGLHVGREMLLQIQNNLSKQCSVG